MSDLPETILSRPPTGPPVSADAVPPVSGNAVPLVSGNDVPPVSSNDVPLVSGNAVPPVSDNTVPASENAVPDAVSVPDAAAQDISLKRRLLDILRQTDAAEQIAGALIREASGAGKSTSVIRAIEEVREIVGNALDGPDAVQPDWSGFSDAQLMAIIYADASESTMINPENMRMHPESVS